MTDRTEAAIALYDRFTHGLLDRRGFMAQMVALAGSAVAAEALIAAIRADDAKAQTVPESRVQARTVSWKSAAGRSLSGYLARPLTRKAILGSVLVVHENRGLTEHIRDVARRFAVAGYPALALDFLSPVGGTPTDENVARDMIGKLDLGAATVDGSDALGYLRGAEGVPVAVTGFCWGGAMTQRLAVREGRGIAGSVPFYGPSPEPALAAQIGAPMMMQLAGKDDRVNSTALPFAEALKAAGKPITVHVYDGVDHAFHNDTSGARYNAEAAKLAWSRTLEFLTSAFAPGND